MSLKKIDAQVHTDSNCVSIVYRRADDSEYHVGFRFFGTDRERDEFIVGLTALLKIYDVAMGHGKFGGRQFLLFPNSPIPYNSQSVSDDLVHGVTFSVRGKL